MRCASGSTTRSRRSSSPPTGVASGRHRAPQEERGRGAHRMPGPAHGGCAQTHRSGRGHADGPRRVVGRVCEGRGGLLRPREDGRGGHAVPPLHLGLHGQAQGHSAHHGRLSHRVYATTKWVFDLKDTDVYWCTADIGWVTGHSYVVYGPLANGTTTVMYEGTPDTPDKDRFWRIIEKHGITICYTAPTAIRTFM